MADCSVCGHALYEHLPKPGTKVRQCRHIPPFGVCTCSAMVRTTQADRVVPVWCDECTHWHSRDKACAQLITATANNEQRVVPCGCHQSQLLDAEVTCRVCDHSLVIHGGTE